MLSFAVLITLILGGNGLIVWQFYIARSRTNRLTEANQQMILVLQLQVSLLRFHQRLDDLARSKDSQRIVTEGGPLLSALREQTQQTRAVLLSLPRDARADPALWPTLETIDATLPPQLKAITELVQSGDWAAVQLRLGSALQPIETQTAILVQSIGQQAGEELSQAVAEMKTVQRTILIIVPATAVSTFFIAAFFGWSMARRMIELRLEERVTERTRIARELHDTLLQDFQGLLFLFQAVSNLLPARPDEAKQLVERAVEQAANSIIAARDAVHELRSDGLEAADLAQAIRNFGKELRSGAAGENPPELRVQIEGTPRNLSTAVRDQAYRIAAETLRNAIRHAMARRIEVEIRYDAHRLRIRIRDDGKGIDPSVLSSSRASGHWGLPGMRERAKLVGGNLEVWSELGSGTEIELSIPAASAYAKPPASRWSALSLKGR